MPLLIRVIFCGQETLWLRLKALAHTWLGVCYAVMLRDREVDHIHVHHGYFGSWIAMTAARLLDVSLSMTLHGSDLLLNAAYLDVKLNNCKFCLTISEYNRNYILKRFPHVDPGKIVLSRLGVKVAEHPRLPDPISRADSLNMLAVGRLHAVKDHAFLLRACAELRASGIRFECRIAGEGPERANLERLIANLGLQDRVTLLGHVERECLAPLYDQADVVVLTSRSEGIPLVLMEAMARGKLVLAPAITGIPELVSAGTGFLYEPGSLRDCVAKLRLIQWLTTAQQRSQEPGAAWYTSEAASYLDRIKKEAMAQVRQNFNSSKNLELFGDLFVARISQPPESRTDANFVLQQI